MVAYAAEQLGLSRKLEPTELAVGVRSVKQVDGIIEVENDRPPEFLDETLNDRWACYSRGPVYQDCVIASSRESLAQTPGQRRHCHHGFFNVVTWLVKQSHQVPVHGRGQVD